jgi:fumarylacetoacetase
MGFQVPILDGSPFTLANLPFGVISTDDNPHPHCAAAIGDYALDLPLYGRHRITSNEEGSLLSVGNRYLIFNEVSDQTPCVYICQVDLGFDRQV